MTETVACSVCGKVHPIDDIELVFELPDVIHALSEGERATRCNIYADGCVLDRERFFLRGLLPIPVSGRATSYSLGVWAEISLDTYRRIYDRWGDPDQRDEPRLPGTLANNLPLQSEDTLGLGVSIQLIGPRNCPEFYVDIHSHPLKREQTSGIDRHRTVEYSNRGRHDNLPIALSAMVAYHLEVTTFEPAPRLAKSIVKRPDDVMASLEGLRRNGVVYVAAIAKHPKNMEKNVDYGNFYLFLNGSGHAHVMLHEHREFFPRDPLSASSVGEATFLDEDGSHFTVPSVLTTSADRARAALEYWLPRQGHWPQFEWE